MHSAAMFLVMALIAAVVYGVVVYEVMVNEKE